MILIIIAILVCVVASLGVYARWHYGTLERMGIKVVDNMHPLLGHTRETYTTVGGLNDMKWMKKYGPIFGVYEGRQPQIFVCVPELVRLICVKDSDYFNDKRDLDFGDPVMNEMPDFQKLEKWRLLRSMATPAFTSAKVKMMNLPMREAAQDFVAELKSKIKAGKGVHEKLPIDVSVHNMLTDLITRCVFSIRISGDTGGSNEFTKIVHELVSPPTDHINPELVMWSHTFPFMKKFMPSTIFKPEPVQRFVKIFRQLMDERRRSGQKMNDVLDMILDWFDKLDSPEYKQAKITELSLMCQALVFFFAAQDQISTMVSGVIYHMTQDAELERRIYEELDEVFAKHKGTIVHEQLNELVLMNSCINECLRLYPFFHRAERVCTKDWRNEEYNLDIKKGTVIQIPIWALNRNNDYNENGEKFDAYRFMPENKDNLNVYASTSFGHGPRNCTGKRFATESMPLILAYILKDLKFKARKDSEIKFIPGGPFFTPHNPIYVDVMERNRK